MENLNFLIKTNLKMGAGEFESLPVYITDLGFQKAGFIVDKAVKDMPCIAGVIEKCRAKLKKCEVIAYSLNGEPTYEYLDACSERFRAHGDIQVFVAIGGGSTMDLAKGIALLMTNPGKGLAYRGFPVGIKDPLPVICIPTTAGTGSETTYNAVFLDTALNKKLGINSTKNFPLLSILDPKLILDCPFNVIVSSGMDALIHAVEGFVSKKASILSRMLSIEAYRLLAKSLKKIKEEQNNLEVLGVLQLGAYLAIMGLANSSAGPAGGLSYLLGGWYRVPHGIAGAVFLPQVQKFNLEHGYLDYALLFDTREYRRVPPISEMANFIINELFEINEVLGVPEKLSAFGVPQDDFEKFVHGCLNDIKGTFELNPVSMSEQDVRTFLRRYFE